MKLYDPAKVKILVAGVPITGGFPEGSFIEVTPMSADFESQAGTDGEVVRSALKDKRGTIKMKLMQSADGNALLGAARTLDVVVGNGAGIGPLLISDLNGNTLWSAQHSWVAKTPDIDYDKNAKVREWTIECAILLQVYGATPNV